MGIRAIRWIGVAAVALATGAVAAEGSSTTFRVTPGARRTPSAPATGLSAAALAAPRGSSDAVGEAVQPETGPAPQASATPPAAAGPRSPNASVRTDTFAFQVCNRSNQTAQATVDHHNPYGEGWLVEGWWIVEPGRCETIGNFAHGWVYYYADAVGPGGGHWGSDAIEKCVRYPGPFQRPEAGGSYTCRRDEALRGFNGTFIEAEIGTYTWTLNP